MGSTSAELRDQIDAVFDTLKKQLAAQQVLTGSSVKWVGVQQAFDSLKKLAGDAARRGAEAEAELAALQEETTPLIETLHAEAEASAAAVDRLTQELRRSKQDLLKAKAEARQAKDKLAGAERSAAEAKEELAENTQRLEAELAQANEAAQQARAEVQEELEATQVALDLSEQELKQTQGQADKDLHAAHEQSRRHEEAARAAEARGAELEAAVQEAERGKEAEAAARASEVARLRALVADRDQEVERLKQWQDWARELGGEELRREVSAREELREKLGAMEREATGARGELRQSQQQVWVRDKRIAELEAKVQAQARERERMQREVSGAREAAEHARRECTAALVEAQRLEGRAQVAAAGEAQRAERHRKELEVRDALARGWQREVRFLQEKVSTAEAQIKGVAREALLQKIEADSGEEGASEVHAPRLAPAPPAQTATAK